MVELTGAYEPWSLRQKWLQKRLARWWYQDRQLAGAACLHVNSQQEAEHVRKLGFGHPIAVIPVGVDLEEISEQKPRLPRESPWLELAERPYVLYLSRLHPKKRLDVLISSWAKVVGDFPNWRLVIAGTGAPAYVEECHKVAVQLGISDKCFWTGHVSELQKSWLYGHAHCYVLPTFSENFGNTVAEALAHGTPVITTHNTPWAELPKHRCGWLVDNSEAELCRALNEAVLTTHATRQTMGINGESLVRLKYSLELTCKNILDVYEWMLNGGPKPDCVFE
jgi:glycosyltransferase involved in cell wall biosynthesis